MSGIPNAYGRPNTRSLCAAMATVVEIKNIIDDALSPIKSDVAALESELAVVNKLDRRIEEVEQYGRRVCLRFDNIQVSANRGKEDCVKIIVDILSKTKCGVGKAAIDRAHRIGLTKTKDGVTT